MRNMYLYFTIIHTTYISILYFYILHIKKNVDYDHLSYYTISFIITTLYKHTDYRCTMCKLVYVSEEASTHERVEKYHEWVKPLFPIGYPHFFYLFYEFLIFFLHTTFLVFSVSIHCSSSSGISSNT